MGDFFFFVDFFKGGPGMERVRIVALSIILQSYSVIFIFLYYLQDFSSWSYSVIFLSFVMIYHHVLSFSSFSIIFITYLTFAFFVLAARFFGFLASLVSGFFDFWLCGFWLSVPS